MDLFISMEFTIKHYPIFVKVMKIREKVLGEEHPDLIASKELVVGCILMHHKNNVFELELMRYLNLI